MYVLLVGVYRPLLRVLRQGLAEDGLTVDVVCPGPEGNGQVPAVHYDAVILDVVRPRDAGLVLVEGWRRAGLQTPVLALTAPGDGDARVPGLRSLADGLLTKPFELDELLRRLRAVARRHGQNEDAGLCCSSKRSLGIEPTTPVLRGSPT